MHILENWDFGFVHAFYLSFSRSDNHSISSAIRNFEPYALDRYIIVQRYAPIFLIAPEADALRRTSKRAYYGVLAKAAVRFSGPAFWGHHKRVLAALNEKLDRPYLALQIGLVLLWIASNPGMTARSVLRFLKRRLQGKRRPLIVEEAPADEEVPFL